MIAAYHADEQGRLSPEIPSQSPCGGWDDKPCRLSGDHDRERKTGPCFPIRVMRCRTHRHAFTLYPPGHVPYGRKRLSPTAFDGQPEPTDGPGGAERLSGPHNPLLLAAGYARMNPEIPWAGGKRLRLLFGNAS